MTETTETKTPTVVVTLATFDESDRPTYRALRKGVRLGDFSPITARDYVPSGMTPLLDAVVEFVEHLRSLRDDDLVNVGLLLDESGSMSTNRDAVIESANRFVAGLREVERVDPETSGRGFLVIATDGHENASRRFGYDDVRRVLAECEAAGWVTVFIGASIDAWGAGRSMGLSGTAYGQTVSTVSSPMGTRSAMASVTSDAASFLASSGEYVQSRASSALRSVDELGNESGDNIGGDAHAQTQTPTVTVTRPRFGHGYDPDEAIAAVTERLATAQPLD